MSDRDTFHEDAKGAPAACVIGWPITHSRSPLIHGHWLATMGISGSYGKRAVQPEEALSFLADLGAQGLVGCNVTVPLKEIAFEAAHEKDAAALAVGAANTLWLEAGRLCASNTDTFGFMRHLEETAPQWRSADRPVLVLGAGGAARAITFGFLQAGIGRVLVANRTRERAEALARHFGPRVVPLDWQQRDGAAKDSGVIVNTTTIGMKGEGDLGLTLDGVTHGAVVADIVYVPLETRLLAAARKRGLAVVDGLGMLLHQAVPGFERWFGRRPEVTAELRHLIESDIEAGG
ncbi:MAG: shikimate dehydrogenase [Hyphomicrobiaceae bacterium]